jgi:DNA mismatch repair protein MutS
MERMRREEIARTGIANLKISFNKVFGYYFEVSKGNLANVPPDYIRKQTLVNAERFITPALKEKEEIILNAQEKIAEIEARLFEEIRAEAAGQTRTIQRLADTIARLDCLYGLSAAAIAGKYTRPEVDDGDAIHIRAGRHPVVEALQTDRPFVPNDVLLSNAKDQILLITGPNMAGKSTFIRQVALLTLMAQMGGFIPASAGSRIGVVDRIFTRVGAMDYLVRGQSTFLVEMSETANILNNATDRSLVILDEIGRGTSTYDGLSIAWAVVEYLHATEGRRPKTLFATHYHELTDLENELARVRNFNVAVLEQGGEITFLYQIVKGSTDHSYGIYAGKVAGLPKPVIERAKTILHQLEFGHAPAAKGVPGDRKVKIEADDGMVQLTLFDGLDHPVLETLRALDVNALTPLQALQLLEELSRKAK